MQKERNSNLDLLRIISCFAVILIHTNYYFFKDELYHPNLGMTYIVESLINIITRFSVPVFIMISGALNLSKEINKDISYLYKKSIRKIFLPVLIAMIPMFFIEVLSTFLIEKNILESIGISFYKVFIGEFFNLWYMYMLVGLYLLTPFIIRLKETISGQLYTKIACYLLVWVAVSQLFSSQEAAWSIGVVVAFLPYYLLGDILYARRESLRPLVAIAVGITCVLLSFVARFLGQTYYLISPYAAFFSPTIIILSLLAFSSTLKLRKNFHSKSLTILANLSFYVYLFHTVVLRIILMLFEKKVEQPELIELLLFTVLIALISLAVAYLYDFFWKKLTKYFNSFFEM